MQRLRPKEKLYFGMRAHDDETGLWFPLKKDLNQTLKYLVTRKPTQLARNSLARPISDRAFFRDFTHLRRAGHFSDAIIKVDNVVFPVHRNILACCSPYFRALFTVLEGSVQSSQGHVETKEAPDQPLSIGQSIGSSAVETYSPGVEGMDFNLNQAEFNWLTCRANGTVSKSLTSMAITSSKHCEHRSPSDGTGVPPLATQTSSSVSEKMPLETSDTHLDQSQSIKSSCCCYEVTITDVCPDIMNEIIEHAYGGQVAVSAHNVEQLLPAADRFQVMPLLKECCDFLASEISVGNCISIVKFASHFYHCDSLRQLGTQFLLDNFTAVFQTSPEFEKLTCKELCFILRADQLNAKHEELVLDAIIRWVIADTGEREKYIPELVSCARVGLMMPDNMGEFVDSWLLSRDLNSDLNKVTLQVMESVLQLQKQQLAAVDSAMFSPRLPRDILFVIGGSNFGFPLNMVEAFDCRTWLWSIICPYDFAPRSYHGMVALDNEIYIIGGFSGQVYLSSCCKLKPDTLTWEDVTPMNTKRCYVGVTALQGCLYAVGGFDGQYRLNSAERFNQRTNQWSFISPMIQQRSDAGVAVLSDKLYVCGGFNGMECIRAVEMYDPSTDQWTPEPSMPRGRSGLGLVAYNGYLYAVGGFDGTDSTVRLSTLESYSPVTRQWTRLEPMPHPRSNLAVDVLEDVLYAIGGYSGDRTTSVVECYDFSTNTWYQSTRLSHNRSALGVCVVSALPNAAKLLRRDPTVVHPQNALREY
ncbi:kelch-like protein 10 [Biomphalaria glabrata]|uniref:Kelch-like protein 10 n=1 Tax=Biomphalaria glabrata TaxID=6526 RepID=A0A9W3BNK0_BIOGL|nr:kelch-like protein 10 [Biomphalaria glabrata]